MTKEKSIRERRATGLRIKRTKLSEDCRDNVKELFSEKKLRLGENDLNDLLRWIEYLIELAAKHQTMRDRLSGMA